MYTHSGKKDYLRDTHSIMSDINEGETKGKAMIIIISLIRREKKKGRRGGWTNTKLVIFELCCQGRVSLSQGL